MPHEILAGCTVAAVAGNVAIQEVCGRRDGIARVRFARCADVEIFQAAKQGGIVVVTKDRDFVELVQRLGTPPQILWLTCGNMTNKHLQQLLEHTFDEACALLEAGKAIVELGD